MAFFDPAVGQIKGVAGSISDFLKTPYKRLTPAPLLAERGAYCTITLFFLPL
jgi:hypothetical protein